MPARSARPYVLVMTSPAPAEVVLNLSCAHVGARALHVVAELGTADAIDAEPRSAEDLAGDSGVDPDALDRLLRLLETHGLFHCDQAGLWGHSEASQWLRSDHPLSLRPFARMTGLPICWGSFTALDHSLRTGEPGMFAVDPGGMWAYLDAHPGESVTFNEAMTAKAHGDIAAAIGAYDYSRFRRVADIGGGRGHLLDAVLAAAPDTSGVVFDLPSVAAGVTPGPRVEVSPGTSSPTRCPPATPTCSCRFIHDWDDERAAAILSAVVCAGRPAHATVLLLEPVMPDGPEPHAAKVLDVIMLAVTGGRERTRAGYETLLDGAGIDLVEIIPTASPISIIEGRVR